MLAAALRLTPIIRADLGENDRSATGYLPKAEFEAMADAFFARPDESVARLGTGDRCAAPDRSGGG